MGQGTCKFKDCGEPVVARGWCSAHYNRWYRYGDPSGGAVDRALNGTWTGKTCGVEGCGEPVRTRGWCKKHYQKWYRTGDAAAPDRYTPRGAPLKERIEAKVAKTGQCWFWLGYLNESGYGCINVNGRIKSAHRASYEAFVGPIPEGLVIDHRCRNRACVNPAHLEPVTHAENVRRGASTNRPSHCRNDHEYTRENTRWVRVCVTCERAAKARHAAR